MGRNGIGNPGVGIDFRTVELPGLLDLFFKFAAVSFPVVMEAGFPCRSITVLLEVIDLGGELSEMGGPAAILDGVGGKELIGRGREEELGETCGRDLKADFRDFTGVFPAKKADEVVLMKVKSGGVILSKAPFLVAAAGLPVGDVADRDLDVVFVESLDDFLMGNVVAEHAVDHITQRTGQTGDLAAVSARDGVGFCSAAGRNDRIRGQLDRSGGREAEDGCLRPGLWFGLGGGRSRWQGFGSGGAIHNNE